jgi:hypothetical protein
MGLGAQKLDVPKNVGSKKEDPVKVVTELTDKLSVTV